MLLYLSLTDPDHFLCQVHQNYLHRDGYDINRKRFSLKVVCYLKNTKLHFPQTGITCETFICISIDWILLSVDDRWQTGAFYSLSASWFGSSAGLSKYCFWEVNIFVINEALEKGVGINKCILHLTPFLTLFWEVLPRLCLHFYFCFHFVVLYFKYVNQSKKLPQWSSVLSWWHLTSFFLTTRVLSHYKAQQKMTEVALGDSWLWLFWNKW